jgi:alpha-glucosidase (family GH31 glycosyl hydrolase)
MPYGVALIDVNFDGDNRGNQNAPRLVSSKGRYVWRVLDAAHLAAVKQAVAWRMRFTPRILELAQAGAATGEPILRPLACVFPDGGYENVKDHFPMGDNLLVAPMGTKDTARTVQIPSGQWKADDGILIAGPVQQTFAVPLGRLLSFERQERP